MATPTNTNYNITYGGMPAAGGSTPPATNSHNWSGSQQTPSGVGDITYTPTGSAPPSGNPFSGQTNGLGGFINGLGQFGKMFGMGLGQQGQPGGHSRLFSFLMNRFGQH